ncbi:MAG: GNAT family N-acetyltransferase [Ferruginibacter sp.]
MEIKNVGIDSIPVIQELAHDTWAVAYKEILSAAQMNYMLELIYSMGALQKQIAEQGHQFILAMDHMGAAGFASWSVKSDKEPATYKLHKIYIDPNHQGKGVGKILLDHILEDVKAKGAGSLELNVNRQNKALGFYQKYGFKIMEEVDIPIGNGYFMNDYIMKLPVNPC